MLQGKNHGCCQWKRGSAFLVNDLSVDAHIALHFLCHSASSGNPFQYSTVVVQQSFACPTPSPTPFPTPTALCPMAYRQKLMYGHKRMDRLRTCALVLINICVGGPNSFASWLLQYNLCNALNGSLQYSHSHELVTHLCYGWLSIFELHHQHAQVV